jgi:hypothetical protein
MWYYTEILHKQHFQNLGKGVQSNLETTTNTIDIK